MNAALATTDEVTEYGLEFGRPAIVMTRRGEREVRSAEPTEEFWSAWRDNKDGLKARGYSVSKAPDGEWTVAIWSETMSIEARKEASEASRAAEADITVPVPEGLELRPFQKAGIAYALARQGTLIGDDMGLGKTIQGIGLANIIGAKRILVVAPASLLINWRNEIRKWQTLDLPIYVIRPKKVFTAQPAGWYVINYDIVARHEGVLRSQEWDLVIFDECQQMKSRNAKRTVALLGGVRKIAVGGKEKRVTVEPVPTKRALALTGTPIMNRPAELFPILHYLDARRWPTWSAFARRYCEGGMTRFGYSASGASNLEELNARLRETVMVRRLKSEVLKELPAKVRQVVELDIESETVQALVDAENAAFETTEAEIAQASYEVQMAEAEGDEQRYQAAVAKLKSVQGVAFSEMAKLRHDTAVAKLPAVIEHLRSTEGKVLVFAHHHDVVDGLTKALADEGVVVITGLTPNEQRQPIVEQFQTDPRVRFFIGNIKAAGVGLTLTAASHVVFAELDWTPSWISQAEDRAHRMGQLECVLVQHLVLDGSLDARMAKIVVAKQRMIEQALDARVPLSEKERAEPVTPVAAVEQEIARPALKKEYPALTEAQIAAVHSALRVVAAYDTDQARALNGVGFSKVDTMFGNDLAARSRLTPRQAAAAMKMVRKYRRQYPAELYDAMLGGAAHE